jgi:Subtilase family/MAM domain, meprin/A5/mu/Secretion system C-terminal sorting domain/Bacterial pre-peptidase C-terminal domain
MKCIAKILCFLALATPVAAQNVDHRLDLASGSLAATANAASWVAAPDIQAVEIVNGYYFRLLQFQATPDMQGQAAIRATGIQLLDYVPRHAYFAAIPANLPPSRLLDLGVRGVHRLTADHKLRNSLKEVPLPAWAVPAPGMVDVEVNFPGVVEEADVRARIVASGFDILESTYAGVVSARIPAHRLQELADQPWTSYIEPINPPAAAENYTGRNLHRSNMIASDHPMGRKYDGTGVVVAMGDDGILGPHIDYEGRLDQSRVTTDAGTHGDHVSGTIMGAGNFNPKHRGMAFGATLHVYQVWNAVNNGAIANAADGVLITSTSYSDGCNAGYTSFAQSMDAMTYQTPTLLHVFSAGNTGTDNCGYGAGAGWGNITGGVKIGKNVVAVAALNANGGIESFSSRGPTADGRLKPDLGAKGGNVTSTLPNNTYGASSGTSMSCPGVSGTTAQLAHAYRSLNGGQDPPSALLKALLLNSADDLGNPGPDYIYGYGELNAFRAVRCLENQTYLHDSLDQAQADTHQVVVPAGTALAKIMVYWHDPQGSILASRPLVNDLDLSVVDPNSTSYLPWILSNAPSSAALNAPATRGRDSLNNQEQVTLTAPAAGTYQVIVRGRDVPMGRQGYTLVYEFRDSSITVTYPNGGESFVQGETEKVCWDTEGNQGTFTVEYSLDSGATWTVASSTVTGSRRYQDVTLPTTLAQSGKVKFRVSRGAVSDESDYLLSLIRVPGNLQVAAACPFYCILDWDSMATASAYDVFMLGNKYMDSIGTTTNSFFQVNGLQPTQSYWFAVRARGADGAVGRRTLAKFKAAGVWNCTEPDDVGISVVSGPGTGVVQNCATGGTLNVQVTLTNSSPNTVTGVPVSYRFDGGTVVTETFTGSLVGNGTATHSFSTPITTTAVGTHTIEAWTSFPADNYQGNDSASSVIEVRQGSITPVPYTEDFETFTLCSVSAPCASGNCTVTADWQQGSNNVTDQSDWRTDRGGTPTNNTGPTTDKFPGTNLGLYLYIESTNCYGTDAMLYTPCFDLSGLANPYFNFWFHKYGFEMGDLHVDIFSNGQWIPDVTAPIVGDWTNKWWERQINLSAYAGQTVNFRFRGITGNGERSDMAIDLIRLTDGTPVGNQDPVGADLFEVYPNPTTGKIIFTLAQPGTEEIRLILRDLNGKVVIQENFTNFTQGVYEGRINIEHQAEGIYFLELEADGRRFTKQVALIR